MVYFRNRYVLIECLLSMTLTLDLIPNTTVVVHLAVLAFKQWGRSIRSSRSSLLTENLRLVWHPGNQYEADACKMYLYVYKIYTYTITLSLVLLLVGILGCGGGGVYDFCKNFHSFMLLLFYRIIHIFSIEM